MASHVYFTITKWQQQKDTASSCCSAAALKVTWLRALRVAMPHLVRYWLLKRSKGKEKAPSAPRGRQDQAAPRRPFGDALQGRLSFQSKPLLREFLAE